MIEQARRHVPNARFQEAAAEELPFQDRTFDLVFLGHLLHEAGLGRFERMTLKHMELFRIASGGASQ